MTANLQTALVAQQIASLIGALTPRTTPFMPQGEAGSRLSSAVERLRELERMFDEFLERPLDFTPDKDSWADAIVLS